MSYTHIKRGDILPTVGVLQLLLNRTGAGLSVDGNFGPKTEAAVKAFKGPRRLGLGGVVDKTTWPRLVAGERLPIVDSVDVTNPTDFGEVTDLRKGGGPVVFRGGQCNGVAQAVQDILGAGSGLFLLRMHGHGASGNIGISEGLDTMTGHRAGIDLGNLKNIEKDLRRLKAAFGVYGSVQLMGCNTGQGARGRRLLRKLADLWGVPVSAGLDTQFSGAVGVFRFEGRVATVCPGGKSLRQWCRGLPKFVEMTPV